MVDMPKKKAKPNSNSKIIGDSCCSHTKSLYSDCYNFIAVRHKHEKRARPCKVYLSLPRTRQDLIQGLMTRRSDYSGN